MTGFKLCFASLCGVLATFALFASPMHAYPTRPITVVVPFPPGGVADGTARVLENALATELGQPVVIENKGGSGGNIGAAFVARSAPDGYTLLMTPNAVIAMNPFTYKSFPFDPLKDLSPIGMIGESYLGLVVLASSPINSISDLIAFAKAKPGELTYAHPGTGSSHHIAGALLNKKAGIDVTAVPFQGAGPSLQSLLGGHISMSYSTLSGILHYVKSGQVKLLGIAEKDRIKSMPEVPTIYETVNGVEAGVWMGLLAPAGTPKDVIDRLNSALNKVLASQDIDQKLSRIGVVAKPESVSDFLKRIQDDLRFWKEAIPLAGIVPQ